MNNLEGQELKKSIKEKILIALTDTNPAIDIYFNFEGEDFIHFEHIEYFAGYIKYKYVSFDNSKISIKTIIDIIVDNIHIDKFKYISCVKKIGEKKCHGHGEYWGINTYTFIYTRI